MEVSNAGKNNGDLIQQWDDVGVTNQEWIIEEVSNGFYKITSLDSKKVIDIKDASSSNGATIHQWDFVNADNQLWYFEKTDDGFYQIKSKKNNKCLDIKGIVSTNGAKIQLWDDVNGDNQKWSIEEIVKKEAPIIAGASYKISNKNSKKSMEVAGGVTNNGGQVQQWDYLEGKNQEWTFEKVDNTYYKIIVNHTGKVLDVKDANKNNGAIIHQWDYVGADNQLWYIEVCDDGYYQIKSKQSNKCLDIYGITTNNGSRLQLWDDVNGDNQKWSIDIVHGEKLELQTDRSYAEPHLQWNAIAGATYQVKRGETKDKLEIITDNITKNTFIDSGSESEKSYYYCIIAKKDGKYYCQSDIVMVQPFIDTDKDGLPDSYEKDVLIPAMLYKDVDVHNPTPDEDYDGDGLSSLEEYKLGTNPFSADTDEDGLSDYDEVHKYNTDPNLYDTDGDGMGDGTEVKNGLNPLIKDTDGNGTIDSQEIFDQVLLDSVYKNVDIQKSLVSPNIIINGSGDYSKQIQINDVSNNKTFSSIHSMVGHPFEIAHNNDLKFESSKLSFKINDTVLQKHKMSNLKIAWYDTNNNKINLLDTQIDDVSKTVSTTVNHFSYYFVIDSNDYYYDIDVLNANSKIDTGKADVVFTIDTTGSIGSSINNVKNNINSVVDKLKADNVDVRLGLVGFKDITCDGKYSTKDYGWFTNVDDFKNAVNMLSISGGGDWAESDVDGLEVSRKKDFRSSVNKYIILLTDASYKNGTADDSSMTMSKEISLLKDNNISVSVITNSLAKSYYQSLYTETNGIVADINGNFVSVLQPLIEKMATISNEGAWIRLSNGSIVHLDKDPALGDNSVDTDKDGIPDLIELNSETQDSYLYVGSSNSSNYKYWTFNSNPAEKDTDGDGLEDGRDINPSKYDICIEENTDDYILFNNGNKWLKFGKDIYSFQDEIKQTCLSIKTSDSYDSFLKSDMYKSLERLVENRKTDFSKEEVAVLATLDMNGVRDYLTYQNNTIVNDVYKILTGKNPHYYKNEWLNGWTDKGETPIQGSWKDFFTGDVKTDAEATLTVFYSLDLNKVIKDVVFAVVVVGATYLAGVEIAILSEGIEAFGAWNALTMYTNGGSAFLQRNIDYWNNIESGQGTVWSSINITQGMYEGTKIPKSFEMSIGEAKFWVHPNATKHMEEYIAKERIFEYNVPVNSQILLSGFQNSVKIAYKKGIKYDTPITVGNWELIFGMPKEEGLLPVIYHALYIP